MKSLPGVVARIAVILLGLPLIFSGGAVAAHDDAAFVTYAVTLENLTNGQPFSPPVAATHRQAIHMFQVGHLASDQLAAIAQDGNEVPMFNLFNGAAKVTEAVDIGKPLSPKNGMNIATVPTAVTFHIKAARGDRFSLATMLICTNDGFLGLDAVKLPKRGTETFLLNGYDAGREQNTEKSADIVDPCSALGPVKLAGDPNGNRDAAVATTPAQPIQHHPGITGAGDLSVALHGWRDPVAKVTITVVDER